MNPHILVAGSANLDFVVRAPHIPAPGETVLGGEFRTFPGGKGANQAVACARAGGVATTLLAAFGTDAHAAPIEASLQEAGVELLAQRLDGVSTGCAFICVSDAAENAITVAPGANAGLRPEHLPALAGFSQLLLQLETPLATVLAFAEAARGEGLAVLLNAAPAQALPAALLATLDVLVVNEGELRMLAGPDGSIADAVQRLPVPVCVVTLGARGCLARTADGWHLQGAYPVTPVDTTAAGDTFCGALAAARAEGQAWPQALARAAATGALACTRAGAQSSIPTRAEVDALMASQVPADTAALAVHVGLDALKTR